MVLLWQDFDSRVLVLFVTFMFASELFIQVRWRTGVSCPHCGFDPVLYLRSHDKAAAKVKIHLEKRQNNPMVLLSAKAKLHIPVLRRSEMPTRQVKDAVKLQNRQL